MLSVKIMTTLIVVLVPIFISMWFIAEHCAKDKKVYETCAIVASISLLFTAVLVVADVIVMIWCC